MKHNSFNKILLTAIFASSFSFSNAQNSVLYDTAKATKELSVELVSMQTILVNAIHSPSGIVSDKFSPSQINARFNLKNLNIGRDIPILLQDLPGVVSSSDAGNGIGYTGIRVRGADASRTNITINGVPINDAESHGTFWVNMPDLASSLGNAQLTRGVGSSTNGAGAFGATLALTTQEESNIPTAQITSSGLGSFNTTRFTIKLGSGIYKLGKNTLGRTEFRSSSIKSDGFINRAESNLSSYFLSSSLLPKNHGKWEIKLIAFGGHEKTYQAWWGVPIEKYNLGNPNTSRADSQLLLDHYQRNLGTIYRNSLDSINLFKSLPSTYNYYTFENEIDNYKQLHHHLNFIRKFNFQSSLSGTLYHTFGTGFFEQFRYGDAFSKYNLSPIRTAGDSNITLLISQSDLVRQRWLRNNLIGVNLYYIHRKHNYSYVLGTGINQYLGHHFGKVIQILALPQPILQHPHQYYNSTGQKFDANVFSKFTYKLLSNTQLTLDAQVRKVTHVGLGTDNDLRTVDFKGDYLFLNPKIFLEQSFGKNSFVAAWMRTNKEPSRSDFTDHPNSDIPKPEQLSNSELTFRHSGKLLVELTAYNMQYYNQLVLTGAVNDVGTPLRRNVENSYRRGIELDARYSIIKNKWHYPLGTIVLLGNIAISKNAIINAPVSWFDYATNTSWDTVYSSVPIAYSPNSVASIGFNWTSNSNKASLTWRTKYVAQQYLDNTGSENRSLPAYSFSELTLTKSFVLPKNSPSNNKKPFNNYSELKIYLQINNVFNKRYVNNAYTYGYLYGSRDIIQEVFVFPQAPTNILLNLQYLMY